MSEDTGNFTIHGTQSSHALSAGTQRQMDSSAQSTTVAAGGTFLGSSAQDRRLEKGIELAIEITVGIIFVIGLFGGATR